MQVSTNQEQGKKQNKPPHLFQKNKIQSYSAKNNNGNTAVMKKGSCQNLNLLALSKIVPG
ncbi:hypothetical protein [Bacillus sp. S14(2024)]|uniref:hypothetical protein n=1 Tax=Bacillus sp. S14(2024) TaxID=3162884 RepID=UPI003D20E94D